VADDPAAARALLDELRSQVHEALAGVRKLAHGVYPPRLDGGGLRAALRLAAASGGRDSEVEVAAGTAWPPELAVAVFFSCVAVLERLPDRATPTIVPFASDAPSGRILIAQRLYAEVEGDVEVEPVGEFVLQGLQRPVVAFNVLALRAAASELSSA
jgi:hypothetical protein